MSNDVDERYSMYFVTIEEASEVAVSCCPFGQTYILSILIFIGRVVDEVGALKAILMDELIVRSNERLVLIFSSMFQVLTRFRFVLMLNIGDGNTRVPSEFLSSTFCYNVVYNNIIQFLYDP
jgi:hypothetical protein